MQRELPSAEDPGTARPTNHHFDFEFFQTLGARNLHDQDSDIADATINEFGTPGMQRLHYQNFLGTIDLLSASMS